MLIIYRCLTFFLFPLFVLLVYLRLFLNKEDKLRFKEKIYTSSFKVNRNHKNKLIWFHAASIGEVLSIMPLMQEINHSNSEIDFLITSVTLSSAKLIERKMYQYKNVTHRYFPFDAEFLSRNFLNSWKPDLVCFVDSEIWPNFLFKIKEKKIPLVLINGRITKKTFNKWKIFFNFAKKVFSNFDLILAASDESKNNLEKFQVKNLFYIGNLKFSIKNSTKYLDEANRKILDKFKIWCAASTHEGEELIAIKTHLELKKKFNNIITIIIPRHINRAFYIKNLSRKFKLKAQVLNENDLINANNEILIINSFGVLDKYFNYCKNVFIGKSLVKKLALDSGQNPIEAAKAGCTIFHGPYVYNFKEIYNSLSLENIANQISTEKELSSKLIQNFKDPKIINEQQIKKLNIYGQKILTETVLKLNNFLK
jgi:3-deoxy-D-manno-octulosonic-acid transferase